MPDNDNVMAVAHEWTAKADNDLRSVEYLLKMENCPTDTICFHAQQSVEKCLKALLVAQGTGFKKTMTWRS
jgi:HEPN domain-containing protein